MKNKSQWCFAWLVGDRTKAGTKSKAALLKSTKWNSGDIITISFLDGASTLRKKVQKEAMEWVGPQLANLVFQFQENSDTFIRISFQRTGSWSVIGTTCRKISDRTEPTMNYGWLDSGSKKEEIRRVVLHEFGHALGLIHEHQHPKNGIQWNKRAVYDDLKASGWSKDKIDRNLFDPYKKEETNFTEFDPKSIMMYPIPSTWTTDGFSTELNQRLSEKDKILIRQLYS